MAVLKKEDFLARIKETIGEDTSEASIQLLEDFSDTYTDLETKSSGTNEWEDKYNKNDKMWRDKYIERFTSDNEDIPPIVDPLDPPDPDDKEVTINDLFTESEVK